MCEEFEVGTEVQTGFPAGHEQLVFVLAVFFQFQHGHEQFAGIIFAQEFEHIFAQFAVARIGNERNDIRHELLIVLRLSFDQFLRNFSEVGAAEIIGKVKKRFGDIGFVLVVFLAHGAKVREMVIGNWVGGWW